MTANLQNPTFTDEDKARAALEAMRWPGGPVCPHCGSVEGIAKAQGKAARPGLYYCNACNEQFTVTVGTIMERSHVPITKWWLAMHLMGSSKKGMSAHQMHRMLGGTYKTAWFMGHSIREAMRTGGLEPMGGEGKVVEMDETYFGKTEEARISPARKGRPYKTGSRGPRDKRPIIALVERGGNVRTFHVAVAAQNEVEKIIRENIAHEATLHTDESKLYGRAKQHVAKHETVKHSAGEYARGDVTTNSVEGYFSVFKRGMKGTYQHCAEKHLHRYLAEFDFRYNNRIALKVDDVTRVAKIAKGIEGKRLTYRLPR